MSNGTMHGFSRREWLSISAGLAIRLKVNARDLSGFYYRDYSKCLPDYLTQLARQAYEKRLANLELLNDAGSVRQRQTWCRETFWKLIGGKPERTPLNPRITGQFDRPGYRLQKLVYESQPQLFVSANLYIPTTGRAPYPGVLFQMGHYYSGKAYASYQKCCQGLARLGHIVLAFDPMGQGERIGYPDRSGTNTRLSSVDEEHSLPGRQLLLLGDSASRFQVWDAIRSLDYLASHPMVDPTRLASTGQSGGGTLTMLLACADERLSAAAVSSGNTEDVACAAFNPPGSTDDAEQNFIGSGLVGFDRWDLLYPIAPKPLLLQVSAHDFFGTYSPRYLEDGREQYERLAKVYGLLGHPDHLGWNSTPLPHALTYSLRLGIYNWFERWLLRSDRTITDEPPVAPEPDAVLWAGATGNVTRDFASLRVFDFVKRKAASLRPAPPQTTWMKALSIQLPNRDYRLRSLAEVAFPGVRVTAAEVNSAPEVWIPGWWFVPAKTSSERPPLLVLDDRGRNADAHEDGVLHRTTRSGRRLLAVDVRGIGDNRPEVGRGNPGYTIPHDSEEDFAWASLILGHSLLAQRIDDILAATRAVQNELPPGNRQVALAARGHLTVPALFAFAACPDISSIYLSGGLVSFQSVLETEIYRQPLANFAWRLFANTDLPVLASQSAPRSVHLAGSVDGSDNLMPVNEVRGVYPARNVRISAEPMWDETVLASV
ncbi:MAG: acetylxylan esterase [Bryobacteraceae bacterium]